MVSDSKHHLDFYAHKRDVIPGPMLAHKVEEDGVACMEFIAGKLGHVDNDLVPGAVYTHPEVASVRKTEEQVKALVEKTEVQVKAAGEDHCIGDPAAAGC